MQRIDQGLIDDVWREMISYPPDRVEAEARAFLERQPHVAGFARIVTAAFDDGVRDAALGLCVLLFKVLEASLGEPFSPVSDGRLRAAHASVTERFARLGGAGRSSAFESPEATEHSLVTHILTVFYGGDPDCGGYDDDVRVSLFLLLLTLTEVEAPGHVED